MLQNKPKIIIIRLTGIKTGLIAINVKVKPEAAEPKAIRKVGAQHAKPVKKDGMEPRIPEYEEVFLQLAQIFGA